eukprot:scaffold43718_cov48-Phaeocystis_antarctica.AAC.6
MQDIRNGEEDDLIKPTLKYSRGITWRCTCELFAAAPHSYSYTLCHTRPERRGGEIDWTRATDRLDYHN